jgi:hypothetical protein
MKVQKWVLYMYWIYVVQTNDDAGELGGSGLVTNSEKLTSITSEPNELTPLHFASGRGNASRLGSDCS